MAGRIFSRSVCLLHFLEKNGWQARVKRLPPLGTVEVDRNSNSMRQDRNGPGGGSLRLSTPPHVEEAHQALPRLSSEKWPSGKDQKPSSALGARADLVI
jgi:hypothetical protein